MKRVSYLTAVVGFVGVIASRILRDYFNIPLNYQALVDTLPILLMVPIAFYSIFSQKIYFKFPQKTQEERKTLTEFLNQEVDMNDSYNFWSFVFTIGAGVVFALMLIFMAVVYIYLNY